MSNYFSNFISRFQVGNFGISGSGNVTESESGGPDLRFITVYNPSWASDKDETLEGATKQILFFLTNRDSHENLNSRLPSTSNDSDTQRSLESQQQLHIIGLLRGSHSLVQDFGTNEGPIAVTLSNQVVVIVEIEPGFFLACCSGITPADTDSELIEVAQIEALVRQTHRRFQLLNSSFSELIDLHGQERFSKILGSFWEDFFVAMNTSSEIPFGPKSLRWPTRLNCEGALLLLKQFGYRKSSIKVGELLMTEMEELADGFTPKPAGWMISCMSGAATKENGLICSSKEIGAILSQSYVDAINEYLQLLFANGCLDAEHLLNKATLALYFLNRYGSYLAQRTPAATEDENGSDSDPEDEEPSSISAFGVTPAAALDLLHPVTLTNNLVVQPLNTTVTQFKNLGLAVSDKIVAAPEWLTRWRGPEAAEDNHSISEPSNSHDNDEPPIKGAYIVGDIQTDINTLLVYIPTVSTDGAKEWREYLLVVYQSDEYILTFIYDSGIVELTTADFYVDLERTVLLPMVELVHECKNSHGIDLSASINSLPGPIGLALSDNRDRNAMIKKAESQIRSTDIDSDFFYIIYDIKNNSYQTSLPDLSTFAHLAADESDQHSALTDQSKPELLTKTINASRQRAIFHLHNQLAGQFFVRGQDKTFFTSITSDEHLHKFSSSKRNDWLFYAMKYKDKVIVIIRNYNHKVKPKAPLEPANSYLTQVADSVYGAANLGFLDNLGSDVKGWLGRLGTQQEIE